MPDIAMCAGTECHRRNGCYRYRAVPSRHQSYMHRDPHACEDFWPLEAAAGNPIRPLPDPDDAVAATL